MITTKLSLKRLKHSELALALFFSIIILKHLGIMWKAYGVTDLTSWLSTIRYFFLFFTTCFLVFNKREVSKLFCRASLFISIYFVFSLINILILYQKTHNFLLVKDYLLVLTSSVVMILIGFCVSSDAIEKYRRFFLAGFLLLIFNILFFIDLNRFSLDPNMKLKSMWGNYLFFADTFGVISCLAVSVAKRVTTKVVISFVSILGLVILNSRAALLCYILGVSIYFFVLFKNKLNLKKILAFIVLGIILIPLVNIISPNKRMFNLEAALKGGSMRERSLMFTHGINDIKNSPIFGSIGGQLILKEKPDKGSYIHNYLSIWRQFGIIPFIIFCSFVIFSFKKIFKYPIDNHYFLLLLFLSFEILFFRSYKYTYIWIPVVGILFNKKN